ncbi:MAG: pbpE, partial [Burkholderiales bacterium]|nr:pbpE [Burkholderiales bacterium]
MMSEDIPNKGYPMHQIEIVNSEDLVRAKYMCCKFIHKDYGMLKLFNPNVPIIYLRKFLLPIIIFGFFIKFSFADAVISPQINDTPAFTALIIKNDKVVFKSAQGCAIFKKNKCAINISLNTPFPICSLTKQFTAVAILMLEEEGKLSTNDNIVKYLPNLPLQFKGIQIKHLIFHISGIPDYLADPNIDSEQMFSQGQRLTKNNIISYIVASKLKPYSKSYTYSNSDYALLAAIIEKVSGETYAAFIRQRIFSKFQMKDSFVMSELRNNTIYAQPYGAWPSYKPAHWIKVLEFTGEGGIFMSINDFQKWIYAFKNNMIFTKPQTMQKFLSTGKYDNGRDIVTDNHLMPGYGLMHGEESHLDKKYTIITHTGGMPGSTALFSNLRNKQDNIWLV